MLFNTIDFVIFFIIVLITFVLIKNRKFHHIFLLLASYFFFYYSSNYLIILLLFTTIWDYFFGRLIWRCPMPKKKLMLIISLAGNLGLLGFFKYADFVIAQYNWLGNMIGYGGNIPFLDLALPIGISFYTFHSITYTVGIYRGQLEPAKSILEYAIFVAFFPQLVAGPILRAKDFLPQLREKLENSTSKLRLFVIHNVNLKMGITIMIFGFFKKMFFADNISPLVNDVFNNPIGHESFTIILATIGFGIQIYCDFSGYTDIALGAALIIGLKIPINFNKPYFATSPSDFWRRWHISLSSWLRDYLYIPLGGNKKSSKRTYINLFVVMFLGGLWHGASWNFVIWGILHGIYLSVHRLIINRFPILNQTRFFKCKTGRIISIIITQYFVFLAWIPFRVKELDNAMYSMQKYVFIDFKIEEFIYFISSHKIPTLLIILFFILHFISYKKSDIREKATNLKLKYWFLFLLIMIIPILFLYSGNPEDFIYFQF